MAVPAHDNRDHEFATTFGLDITTVVEPIDRVVDPDERFTGDGRAVPEIPTRPAPPSSR